MGCCLFYFLKSMPIVLVCVRHISPRVTQVPIKKQCSWLDWRIYSCCGPAFFCGNLFLARIDCNKYNRYKIQMINISMPYGRLFYGFWLKRLCKRSDLQKEPQLIKRHSFMASDLTSRLPYKNDERLCILCNCKTTEDESHFLLDCPS